MGGESILSFLFSFIFLMVAMVIHEFSHAWIAYKLGDYTIKTSGRLTLNPFAHIHFLWTFILPLFLFISSQGRFVFGAAKPVPINLFYLKNPKKDIIWIGLAGPLSNFIFAFLLSLLLRNTNNNLLKIIIENLIVTNVVLALFNLLPIPPLDGSKIIMGILPSRLSVYYVLFEPLSFVILIFLSFSGIISIIILPLISFVLKLMGINLR